MDLPQNPFKRALREGKPQIGLWSSLSSNYTVEVIAGAGFDWILIDMEHSPNDLESLLSQLQAAAPYPSHPVVRVPWNDMVTIKRVLDAGAQSLLIPYVQNAEEAKQAVAYTRYPPAGVRGVAGTTRATRFGRVKNYAKRAHEEICVLVQLETQTALAESGGDKEFAAYPENHRFQIPPEAHWRELRKSAKNVGRALQNAMRAIETANPDKLYGIFGDAQWTNKDRLSDAMLRDLVEHFSMLDLTIAALPEDELGNGYEYLIKKFAAEGA